MNLTEGKMTKGERNDPPTTSRPSKPEGQQPEKRYPECEKLQKVSSQSNTIGEFLEWLSYEKNLSLCELDEERDYYHLYHYQIEQLLAEFFEIDLNKVEQERRQILEDLQK